MKENGVSNANELDAALASSAMHKRNKLWRTAEGRSLRLTDVLGGMVGVLVCLVGFYEIHTDREFEIALYVAIGLGIAGFVGFHRHQSQIDALRELVRLNEERTTNEHRA